MFSAYRHKDGRAPGGARMVGMRVRIGVADWNTRFGYNM